MLFQQLSELASESRLRYQEECSSEQCLERMSQGMDQGL